MTESTAHPPSGLWIPTKLQRLFYGPETVQKHLVSCLPTSESKAFIITNSSLATKTPLVHRVEELLTPSHHAGTFSRISQHAPVAQLDEASEIISADSTVDTVISIGGGSPIDSAKALSHRYNQKHGRFLHHVTIPTTLSAAECTSFAGYTSAEGLKVSVGDPACAPACILYDASFARETPSHLFLSTGIRALDHAIELMYHPTATEVPTRQMALLAAGSLFRYLPLYKAEAEENRKQDETITQLQLAAFASLGFVGLNLKGGLGLSHSLGYALGSPYGIPHGVTSCLTLGHVVKLKAEMDPAHAQSLARMLPAIGVGQSFSPTLSDEERNKDAAIRLGDAVLDLVRRLDLKTTLTELKVERDQAEVIAKRATRAENGELFEKVKKLAEGLW